VDPVTETSEAAVTVPGEVEVIDANEVIAVDGGKLAVNVNPLTVGVASVSPMLDKTQSLLNVLSKLYRHLI
jgi:hypothetical protein